MSVSAELARQQRQYKARSETMLTVQPVREARGTISAICLSFRAAKTSNGTGGLQ
jgi:hypothetical protein